MDTDHGEEVDEIGSIAAMLAELRRKNVGVSVRRSSTAPAPMTVPRHDEEQTETTTLPSPGIQRGSTAPNLSGNDAHLAHRQWLRQAERCSQLAKRERKLTSTFSGDEDFDANNPECGATDASRGVLASPPTPQGTDDKSAENRGGREEEDEGLISGGE